MPQRRMQPRLVFLSSICVVCVLVIVLALVFRKSRDPFTTNDPEVVNIANAIESIVKKFKITSICDVACGNSAWVPILLDRVPSLKYVGYESSGILAKQAKTTLAKYKNATVEKADPMTVTFGATDLVICRSYLETLSYEDLRRAVIRFSQYNCKYFALGNYSHETSENKNIQNGGHFPLNLEKHPFNMSPAHVADEGKSNRHFFVYTFGQMQGYMRANAFWTEGMVS